VTGLVDGGLARWVEERVVLTSTGRLMATDITARLVLAGAVGPD
jgi:hypothetical protein